MNATEQTTGQVERAIRKLAQKFACAEGEDVSALTDIHFRVSQDSGELVVVDDDDNEITRCVVEQWIDNKSEQFYRDCAQTLRECLNRLGEVAEGLAILKPYSYVLETDEKEHVAELYVVDDDTVIIGGDLMKDLDSDLDTFLDSLMKEEL